MNKITSRLGINKVCLTLFILLLISVFTSEKAFSRQHSNGDINVSYDANTNLMSITFLIIDYHFGPFNENGFLSWCDFYYTTDNVNYTYLMRSETKSQSYEDWSWVKMRYKRPAERLYFSRCYIPAENTMWPDDNTDMYVEVKNKNYKDNIGNKRPYKAYLTIKWNPYVLCRDIKNIKVKGFWKVNGVYIGDNIDNVFTPLMSMGPWYSNKQKNDDSALNSEITDKSNNQKMDDSESNSEISDNLKVRGEADGISVKGAKLGETIKIYNASGIELKSVVAKDDVVNIKLPKNQIYFIKAGQTRRKVAL